MRRLVIILAGLALVGAVCWVLPPFRVVSLQQAQAAKAEGVFDAAEYAARFWRERLTPACTNAPDAQLVWDALATDPTAAATKFGRVIGMSDAVYYFVRGTGTVVSVEGKSIGVALRGADTAADLVMKTGLLFGNTIRDATGLLNGSEFPNSQNFNDISTALNHIVETQVLPNLRTNAVVGRGVRFVVGAEIVADEAGERPINVIPVWVEFP